MSELEEVKHCGLHNQVRGIPACGGYRWGDYKTVYTAPNGIKFCVCGATGYCGYQCTKEEINQEYAGEHLRRLNMNGRDYATSLQWFNEHQKGCVPFNENDIKRVWDTLKAL